MYQALLIFGSSAASKVEPIKTSLEGSRCFSLKDVNLPDNPLDRRSDSLNLWTIVAFRSIANEINNFIEGLSSEIPVCFLQLEDDSLLEWTQLDPLSTENESGAVAGMLILAFPEVFWILNFPSILTSSPPPSFDSIHLFSFENIANTVRRLDEGFNPIFDATGIRNYIRSTMSQSRVPHSRSVLENIPLRKEEAGSIDEEISYRYFTAYSAYRFGFRSHLISSKAALRSMAALKKLPCLLFEDIALEFSDDSTPMADIETRNAEFPFLRSVPLRIFVSAGTDNPFGGDLSHRNELYIRDHQKRNTFWQIFVVSTSIASYYRIKKAWARKPPWKRNLVALTRSLKYMFMSLSQEATSRWHRRQFYRLCPKPLGGIFRFWVDSGLERRLRTHWTWRRGFRGYAEGYSWPPPPVTKKVPMKDSRHSAPGRLNEIAKLLIDRSRTLLLQSSTVEENVYGALLALDAQELLANRTPTLALEALGIRQQHELTAECLFYGNNSIIDIENRLKNIQIESESVCSWFASRERPIVLLGAQARIINEAVLTLRRFNHFYEELTALRSLRRLERKVKSRGMKAATIPIAKYFDALSHSPINLSLSATGCIFFIMLLFVASGRAGISGAWLKGFLLAIDAFLGGTAGYTPSTQAQVSLDANFITVTVGKALGLLHLGLFVSAIFFRILRR